MKYLASKADKHEGALTSIQEKMYIMENDMMNGGKEAQSFRERVKEMFHEADLTLTFSPIAEED